MSLLGETTITRRRFGTTTWTDGRATEAPAAVSTFRASVQPLAGRDRQVLPQGIRSRVGRKVYCPRGTLRVDDQDTGDRADEVVISGEIFTVVHVDNEHPLLEHDRAFVLRTRE